MSPVRSRLEYSPRMGRWARAGAAVVLSIVAAGCDSNGRRVEMQRHLDELKTETGRLTRELAARDADIDALTDRIHRLESFDDPEAATMFAPARVRISPLSGGKDYDGVPGDDGVTVYVQPIDADGNVVTVGGRLTVQLIDNADMTAPRVVGLVRLKTLDEIRRAWHGRFLTNHYTVRCPWLTDVPPPASRRVDINVEFVDFLTGTALRARHTVEIEPPPGSPAPASSGTSARRSNGS